MNGILPHSAEQFVQDHRRKKLWQQVVTGMACIVVFCTVYALILPAITLEKVDCEIPEHEHTLGCYTQITTLEETVPVCTPESLAIHEHTIDCYDPAGNLICGQADFVLHRHTDECYTEDGELWCTLPEITVSDLDPDLYTDTPWDSPDGTEDDELSASEKHIHTAACYEKMYDILVCDLDEDGHQHTEDCYDADGALVCGEEERQGHIHTEDCYLWNEVLTCSLTGDEAEEPEFEAEPEENSSGHAVDGVTLHRHTAACSSADGQLVCGKLEVYEHQHTENCFELQEVPVDPDELTCTLEEDGTHTHGPLCYGQWELTCTLEEHIHGTDCEAPDGEMDADTDETDPDDPDSTGDADETGPDETDPDQTQDQDGAPEDTGRETVYLCGLKEHLHDDYCYNTSGELTCTLEEHTHSAGCVPLEGEPSGNDPDAEDQQAAQAAALLLEALPTRTEAEETLSAWDRVTAPEDYRLAVQQLQTQAEEARLAYDLLTPEQQALIPSAALDRLTALEELLLERNAPDAPVLTDDSAYVSTLTVTGSESNSVENASGAKTVCTGDTVTYHFLARTESYTAEAFREGRVSLEFVLPLAEEQAAFDLAALDWLEEYRLTTQTRTLGDSETTCQVLTGFRLLSDADGSGSAVPGGFTASVPITVLEMEPGESLSLQISAAMEYNQWDGECPTHLAEEKLTVSTDAYTISLPAGELQATYQKLCARVEALECLGELDNADCAEAEALLDDLQQALDEGLLTDVEHTALHRRVFSLLYGSDPDTVAEAAVGDNWMLLRDSGWFEEYSYAEAGTAYALRRTADAGLLALDEDPQTAADDTQPPSGQRQQINDPGGTKTSSDNSVAVSKTIQGTELENVFDITLKVQTTQNMAEITTEPDMAVVIVMDISNTMKSNFGDGTRYEAAMLAAEEFLDNFAANNSMGISKVGYVAFNTDGHKIFDLQPCTSTEQAKVLKNTMRTVTGNIINQNGYGNWNNPNKFTNMEAGLAVARDMLAGATNENKYVIFLSDGFPTTYIKSGYTGHVPIHEVSDDTHNYIRDDLYPEKPFTYGTNYSDRGAVKAREMATSMKDSGITIFSIGVNVSGQSLEAYITQSEREIFSTMDRTSATYDIGGTGTGYFESWLRDKIGSGYYYDSTDSAGLSDAYEKIFKEIKHKVEASSAADWVAADPLPNMTGSNTSTVEFIGFYDKTSTLATGDLSGAHEKEAENTAAFEIIDKTIRWDLKKSGYTTSINGSTTTYTYQLVYRVRLQNEASGFVDSIVYRTNDTTTLTYRTVSGIDGNLTISPPKTVDFPIPSVYGYLVDLTFTKVDTEGKFLAGAEFALTHDIDTCGRCRGDAKTSVSVPEQTVVSGENGTVTFDDVPSGHIYTLRETKAPDGYALTGTVYTVAVAYDQIIVTYTDADGKIVTWAENDYKVVNQVYYELPSTGGPGTLLYTAGGLLLTGAALLLLYHYTKRRKEDIVSS